MSVREERKELSKGKCEICGFRGEDLHHVFPGRKNRKISERIETVRWLCHNCHMKLHGKDFETLQRFQREASLELFRKYGEAETIRIIGKIYTEQSPKTRVKNGN